MVKDMIENLLVNVFDREIATDTLIKLLGESLDKSSNFDQSDTELKKCLTTFLKDKSKHTEVIDKRLNELKKK